MIQLCCVINAALQCLLNLPLNVDFIFDINNELYLGFNRLQVNGIDDLSNQPFYYKKCYIVTFLFVLSPVIVR